MLDNKSCHMKLLLNGFHFNGNIIGVRPQTQKLEPPLKTTWAMENVFRVFISGYANTGEKFAIAFEK